MTIFVSLFVCARVSAYMFVCKLMQVDRPLTFLITLIDSAPLCVRMDIKTGKTQQSPKRGPDSLLKCLSLHKVVSSSLRGFGLSV